MEAGSRKRLWLLLAGVFVVSFALLFLLMDRRLNMYDEGLVLVDAMRTLHGDVIHRDYYTPYGPGASYVVAALFKLDSHWFIMGRLYGIALMAGIVTVVFGLLVGRAQFFFAVFFAGACMAMMLATPYYLYPLFPCLFLSLIGSALLLRWMKTDGIPPLLLAGCTTGLAALFRYDAGFFIAIAHCILLSSHIFLTKRFPEPWLGKSSCIIALYAIGTLFVFLPFAVAYLRVAPLASFYGDIIDYPLHYYAAMRGLPFPRPLDLWRHPDTLAVYLPILAIALALVELRALRRSELTPFDRRQMALLLVLTPLAAVLYYKGVVRVSAVHMLMSTVPSLALYAIVCTRAWTRGTRQSRAGTALMLALVLWAAVPTALDRVGSNLANGQTPLNRFVPSTDTRPCPVPPALTLASQDPDYAKVSAYIRRFSRPDEKIMVGLQRHDKIFINSVALYFSTGRLPGTHWHQFDPGLQNRADIQALMIADLKANAVRWIIRDSSFKDFNEPNGSSLSSGVDLLDRYLAGYYRRVAQFGDLEIWLLKSVSEPHYDMKKSCFLQALPG